jgi:hypothetical protein
MSKTPIEMMMDGVSWRAVDGGSLDPDSDLPYVTHEGVLEIGGMSMRVYRISTGQAIINADDMRKFFGDLLS